MLSGAAQCGLSRASRKWEPLRGQVPAVRTLAVRSLRGQKNSLGFEGSRCRMLSVRMQNLHANDRRCFCPPECWVCGQDVPPSSSGPANISRTRSSVRCRADRLPGVSRENGRPSMVPEPLTLRLPVRVGKRT